MGSRFYPAALQLLFGAAFALVLAYAFWGPPLGENNLAVVVTWKLWWLLLPLSFLLFGRLWCAVCPVGAASDLAQKVPLGKRRTPGAFLRRGGVWIAGSLFLLLFWVGMVRHVCCFPLETAIVLLLFVAGAVLMGLAYRGRAWCRYLCPLSVFTGLFSMLGLIGLRSTAQVCRNACRGNKRQVLLQERESCPLFELPMALDSNRNCNLCGNCVKFCPYDSMRLVLLRPGAELWRLRRPVVGEALFGVGLVALAFVEVVQTTRLFPAYMRWAVEKNVLSSYDAVFSWTLAALVAVVVGSYGVASYLSTRLGSGGERLELARFGYGFVPLALAGYLSVAIFRFANQGLRAVKVAINQLTLSWAPFELPPPVRGSFYEVNLPLKTLQFAILALGTLGTLYLVVKIARRGGAGAAARALPHVVLAAALSAVFVLSILQPAGIILH